MKLRSAMLLFVCAVASWGQGQGQKRQEPAVRLPARGTRGAVAGGTEYATEAGMRMDGHGGSWPSGAAGVRNEEFQRGDSAGHRSDRRISHRRIPRAVASRQHEIPREMAGLKAHVSAERPPTERRRDFPSA